MYRTFVCGTLFGGIKLIELYSPKQSSTYKSEYDGLEKIEKPSRAMEVNLGSSTDRDLGHNPIILLKFKKTCG